MYTKQQKYECKTCGRTIPPYQSFCDQHMKVGEAQHTPNLLDRVMNKLLGR